ncbi:Sphingomyelin phosphodiesterase 2 [Parelaphostrongylus tenuis]|uniref:Sphingomyelin phosphodiesterase 2 n=1 Tax=Parelaphostrongylus tenuis TaxID=148309 RepID=A0AAD5QWN5_PARTN|nr:Sphingomyelin phosphodiesterase 2 [Parelaphostrongylus tenuis]
MRVSLVLLLLTIGFISVICALPNFHGPDVSKDKVIRLLRQLADKRDHRAAYCNVCSIFVDGVNFMIQRNKTDIEIAKVLTLRWLFVLANAAFKPNEICGAIVDDCGQPQFPLNVMWNITIPDKKPPLKPWPPIPDNKPTYKVLHLSDIHIDRQYAIGSEAHCQLDGALRTYAMCCRNYTDDVTLFGRKRKPIYVPSGPWGMPYACDIPYQTFEAAVKHISTAHSDLDYIIITGDFEAHDSWDYTQDLTRSNINNITDLLLQYFPNIPVYVSIGNHEGVPQDA